MTDRIGSDDQRSELERVRAEAQQEIARLQRELAAVRELAEAERDIETVTEQVALKQEVDTLHHSLREKERVVNLTAAQCRRLEDDLEDQHLAYDGLKQDLDRKKVSLSSAREQLARLGKERGEIEERYHAMLVNGGGRGSRVRTGAVSAGPSRAVRPTLVSRGLLLFALAVGLVLALGALVTLRPNLLPEFSGAGSPGTAQSAVPAEQYPPPEAPPPEDVTETSVPPVATADQPVVSGAVRDRLRNGSRGASMVALQGGGFTMGKATALPSDDRGPAREVRISPFLIGATEVTFEEYDRFARATGGRLPKDFGWGRGQRPVVDVSWREARAYANWLSRQTGRQYRLPSEAEWEYAASAGRRTAFWWGLASPQGRAACFDCGTRWDKISTAPVGSFAANPLGLFDTAGNVMEWTQDCYFPNYQGAPPDGQPRDSASCDFRVARGGAFNKPARSMQSTARHRFAPETRLDMLGFRVARDQ